MLETRSSSRSHVHCYLDYLLFWGEHWSHYQVGAEHELPIDVEAHRIVWELQPQVPHEWYACAGSLLHQLYPVWGQTSENLTTR